MNPSEKKLVAAKRRRELRERAIAYLGGSCRICGYDKCPSAFDFHHVNALEKDFTISSRMTSWAAIERELKKCVLLCARCHREVHDGLHPGYLEDESHMRVGYDDRQIEMFEDPMEAESWVDPTVTPEQIRAAMEKPTGFEPRPLTVHDFLPIDGPARPD